MRVKEDSVPLPGDFLSAENNEIREGESNLQSKELNEVTVSTQKEESDPYLKGLKIANTNKEEAISIMDAIVTHGLYTEYIMICNRINVVLGTRSYRDLQRASQLIDNADVNLPMHVNDLIARYNLAASLRSYGDKSFKFPLNVNEASVAFQERLDFIYTLPEVVVNQLIQHLHEFDFKVSAVFAKGAPEDF